MHLSLYLTQSAVLRALSSIRVLPTRLYSRACPSPSRTHSTLLFQLDCARKLAIDWELMAGSDSPSALERGEGSPETLELGNLSSAPTITNSSSSNTTTTTTTSGPSFAGLSGFPGLAALMAEDPQFNLHSCFEAVGIEVLLHSERIVRNNVKRLRHLQNRNSGRPQAGKLGITRGEIRLIRKLRRELTIHCECGWCVTG
ncbi:hypothetical protein B0T17DRAFT_364305 [Bombardia bombarda]|uniref:Uncharacterized protein n=1 Tax=Bombardia bombarda TaxID=252184 RepID=A0AA40BWE2_9PEZI|nr:hypothetical protein B0T17DRAFT_364305 [Bombardia bombarda]